MVDHLVGLQAQENLPPYLSLAARLDDFDPYAVTRALEERSLVRLTEMRGTIHLLTRRRRAVAATVDPARPGPRTQDQPEHAGPRSTSTPTR